MTLSNPTGGAVLGGPSTATVRINANDQRDRTGPLVTRVLETGPSRGITGAVVHFNEDLDPARAQNVAQLHPVRHRPRAAGAPGSPSAPRPTTRSRGP